MFVGEVVFEVEEEDDDVGEGVVVVLVGSVVVA